MKKVLVVDNEEKSRLLMSDILQGLGFEVFTAENAEQADISMKQHPEMDLMLLDFNLPKQSGYEFLVQLRLTPEHLEKPAIMMVTTEHGMGSMLSALAAGADEYIMKPFDKDIVMGKLDIIGVPYQNAEQEESTCH